MKILCVDDEPLLLNVYRRVLKEKGEVLVAANGIEALELWERQKPDFILTDNSMPKMNGLELLAELPRRSDHLPPRVMATAVPDEELYRAVRDSGAAGMLVKPSHTGIVSKVIDELVKHGVSPALWKHMVEHALERPRRIMFVHLLYHPHDSLDPTIDLSYVGEVFAESDSERALEEYLRREKKGESRIDIVYYGHADPRDELTLIQKIREFEQSCSAERKKPIIVATTFINEDMYRKAMECGATAVIDRVSPLKIMEDLSDNQERKERQKGTTYPTYMERTLIELLDPWLLQRNEGKSPTVEHLAKEYLAEHDKLEKMERNADNIC